MWPCKIADASETRSSQTIKVQLFSHDLSLNCLGRAHILAQALQEDYEVEIIGPAKSGSVWFPLRDESSVPIRIVPSPRVRDIASAADGDILYAIKPKAASFGAALLARKQQGRPLIFDIDDFETGFYGSHSLLGLSTIRRGFGTIRTSSGHI